MKTRQGFTLIELLIAMSITAVLITGIVSAFSTGIYSWQKIQQYTEVNQDQMAISEAISLDLRGAWMSYDGKAGEFILQTNDEDQEFTFTSLVPGRLNNRLTTLLEISYLYDNQTHVLTRQQKYYVKTTGDEETDEEVPVQEDIIAENIAKFEIRCWDGEEWQDFWDAEATSDEAESSSTLAVISFAEKDEEKTTVLPALVKITINFNAESEYGARPLQIIVPIASAL